MSLWERLSDLPLVIEGYTLETLALQVFPDFTRKTTVLRLRGGGEEGVGEDVGYDARSHDAVAAAGPVQPIAGRYTLASFSAHLERLALFPRAAEWEAERDYRRWAYESAALDLALRQAGRALPEVLGREVKPLRFVGSMHGAMEEWLALYPAMRFKLDAHEDWTDARVAALAATGAVDVVDLKGHYRGTPVDLAADPALYRRIAEGLPDVLLEDPWLDERTKPVLEPYRDRLTWDAPIHSVEDVRNFPFLPRWLNSKPSRFGTLARLLAFYEHCEAHDVRLYGGGQFELGPGRAQVQLLAAMFHPEGPNDVAPAVYNRGGPRPGLPESPLAIPSKATGF
ncbi:MAG TPA: hypothetical protein VFV75_07560 [Candidatus Polarisedimenticolaceae bacterium]|nr:hypothetical protein [Candidatus Polarisedimenticolaceae bacterium]